MSEPSAVIPIPTWALCAQLRFIALADHKPHTDQHLELAARAMVGVGGEDLPLGRYRHEEAAI